MMTRYIYAHVRGLDSSSGMAPGYGVHVPGSISGIGGMEIFLLRVQTGPGVHSASCKMSTGGKTAERTASHPTSS